MTTDGGTTVHHEAPDSCAPLPGVIWAFAWSFVVSQGLALATVGAKSEGDEVALSALLGVAVVTLFAHGVLRAGLVRFWVVVVLLVLGAVVDLVQLVEQLDAAVLARFALSVVQLYLLNAYSGTEWFRWHRRHRRAGPSVAGPLLIAVVVGVMVGLVDTDNAEVRVDFTTSF